MKKIAFLIFALLLCFVLASCTASKDRVSQEVQISSTRTESKGPVTSTSPETETARFTNNDTPVPTNEETAAQTSTAPTNDLEVTGQMEMEIELDPAPIKPAETQALSKPSKTETTTKPSTNPAENQLKSDTTNHVTTKETTSQQTIEKEPTTQKEEKTMKETQFYIKAGSTTFIADFADNSSADALRDLLHDSDLTVDMHDYGNFEKVGEIGHTLPQNNTQITTSPGDVILYLGTNITIYYDRNSWNFTRLGKIQNVTKDDLLSAFGKGNVTVTFSLSK